MDVNNTEMKDGDPLRPSDDAPSIVEPSKQKLEGILKKKRRRGKSKRKIMKPFMKVPWQDRRKNDKSKRNNRFRKIVLSKTHAPFNNNQFLMEIHKPEPENNFNVRTPSARTRDSSFSVDSEDNYFFSLPEDEEEYLTKEFSSVYEDAQSERLSNMSKNDLIQEYLLLEAKYENLIKRTERSKSRPIEEDKDTTERDTSATDCMTDRDTSATSIQSTTAVEEPTIDDIMLRVKEQDEQIHELQVANEKLRAENECLRQRSRDSSSEDSESDSSSTSGSSSSSVRSMNSVDNQHLNVNGEISVENPMTNGHTTEDMDPAFPIVNGFHDSSEHSQ